MARPRNPRTITVSADRFNGQGKVVEQVHISLTVNYTRNNTIDHGYLHVEGEKLTKSYQIDHESVRKLQHLMQGV